MRSNPTFTARFAVSALSLLLACDEETVAQPPAAPVNWHSFDLVAADAAPPSGPTASERAVAEAYVAAISAPGMKGLGALLEDDAHCALPGRDDVRGRESVVRAHEGAFGAVDDRRVTISRVFRTATSQVLEWTMTGVEARDWLGLAATKRTLVLRGVTLLWTRDHGTISDARVMFDANAARAALADVHQSVAAPVTSPTQVFEQVTAGEQADGERLVRLHLDALENNDEKGYLGALADDVVLHSQGHEARGKDGARSYFRALRKGIGQLDTTVESIWGVGPFVIVEYWIQGEQLAEVDGLPFQRLRTIRMENVDIVETRGGKISSVWRYQSRDERSP